MIRRLIIAVLSGALLSAAPLTDRAESTARAAAFATDPDAVERHLAVWDLSAARSAAAALPEGPLRDFKAGAVAFYEAEYTRAEAQLARALASEELDDDDAEEAQHLLDLTRGARRALGEPTVLRSPDGKVELVLASPKDALIAPYLFEAMAAARDALGGTLGVWPDHPVRFEILDAPEKLALVTPLTRENVYTTGTVGVTKYRRIMMLTPRIMPLGYPWIDTAVHEYVHYLLTLRTRNNAPVWVQEGLAKLLEERWRRPDPSPLAPPSARLLRDAIRKDELVTLDQMYPSVAMLPSQEQAALAYAEVQTMLGFLLERRGGRGLGVLLDEISRGTDAREAMAIAWGEPFDQFHAEWLTYARKEATARAARDPGKPLDRIKFKDSRAEDDDAADEDAELRGDIFSHMGGGEARQHARLGVLLTLRGHQRAAAMQYERAREADPKFRDDPTLARRLGALYLKLGEPEQAAPLLTIAGDHDPDQPNVAADEARARRLAGDLAGARAAAMRAIRVNPFIPAIHCDLAALANERAAREREE